MAEYAEKLQSTAHLLSHSCSFIVRFYLTKITSQNPSIMTKKEVTFFEEHIILGEQKRKRITSMSLRSAIKRAVIVTRCFVLLTNLLSHTVVSTELTLNVIDRTLNKNSSPTFLMTVPFIFISYFPSNYSSDYNTGVLSEELYFFYVWNTFLNTWPPQQINHHSSSFLSLTSLDWLLNPSICKWRHNKIPLTMKF